MNIKKIIKLSFLLVIGLIILLASINIFVLKKIEINNTVKNRITQLINVQENMNTLVLDSIIVQNATALDIIKRKFLQEDESFKENKHYFEQNMHSNFIDRFVPDIYKESVVQHDLKTLYLNEANIKQTFNEIYVLQNEKLKLNEAFIKNYPLENKLRKALQVVIWESNNTALIKDFADLKYYSKEALYQHRNEKYLGKWLQKAQMLKRTTQIKGFETYIEVIHTLTQLIRKQNGINKSEKALIQSIQKILEVNNTLNSNIQRNIEKVLDAFITSNNILLISVLSLTLIFVIFFALKVYKHVGLSVDDINNKVNQGMEKITHLNNEIETTQKEVVFTMGAIGESRSKETGNHVKRVAEYSKLLALYYGLSSSEAEMLKQASPMHDIGKVAIPDSILNKPGRFNEEERIIMNTHSNIGYEMLKNSNRPLLQAAATVAKEHHEKWDGSGYPNGLKKEEIHIYGRITALADVFDALGSDRVYKKAWEDERIFNLFKEERGKHFDPTLVDIFFEHLHDFLAIRRKFQDV